MQVTDKVKLWTPQSDMQERNAERIVNDLYDAKIRLELFDADTGKLQERVDTDNYATDILLSTIKWFARQFLSGKIAITAPTNNSSTNGNIDSAYAGANLGSVTRNSAQISDNTLTGSFQKTPQFVVLTDASHTEDQTNDRILRGRLTAFSYVDQYTGTDTFRGTQNSSESVAAPAKSTFVFDWPTNSGNGNINSVYWAWGTLDGSSRYSYVGDIIDGNVGYGSSLAGAAPAGKTPSNNGSFVEKGLWLDPDGVHYWTLQYDNTASAANMVKRSLVDGSVTSTLTLAGQGSAYGPTWGFAFDGTNWWTFDQSVNPAQLRKFNGTTGALLSTTTVTTLGMPTTGGTFGGAGGPMFIDKNNMIWIGYNNSLYQINPATPSLVTSLATGASISFGSMCGCYYQDSVNGDELWVFGSKNSNTISRFDLSGNFRGAFQMAAGGNSNGFGISSFGVSTYAALANTQNNLTDTLFSITTFRQFWTRSLLPSLVTKANTQTMKLTYEFDYS